MQPNRGGLAGGLEGTLPGNPHGCFGLTSTASASSVPNAGEVDDTILAERAGRCRWIWGGRDRGRVFASGDRTSRRVGRPCFVS